MTREEVRAQQSAPTEAEQLARTEFTLAWWLSQRGQDEAAERHYVRAGELAPQDFMICRGSMPIRGLDPMGEDFMAMVGAWTEAGKCLLSPPSPTNGSGKERMPRLEGSTAIITGAAHGIGNGMARVLAAEGARLALCDIDPAIEGLAAELEAGGRERGRRTRRCTRSGRRPALRRRGDHALWAGRHNGQQRGDLARHLAPRRVGEGCRRFDAVIATNLKGVFLCGLAIAPHMAKNGSGHIVSVATDHICPPPGYSTGGGTNMDVYDASKWGMNGLTQAWARVLEPHGVRVNALCMDATDSNMIRGALGRTPPPELLEHWMRPEQIGGLLADLLAEGPQGRTGENIGIWLGHDVILPP